MPWWRLLSIAILIKPFTLSFFSSTFDKDKDGFLTTQELRKIMKDRMAKKDLAEMIKEADSDNDGFINCQGDNPKRSTVTYLVTFLQSFAPSSAQR